MMRVKKRRTTIAKPLNMDKTYNGYRVIDVLDLANNKNLFQIIKVGCCTPEKTIYRNKYKAIQAALMK